MDDQKRWNYEQIKWENNKAYLSEVIRKTALLAIFKIISLYNKERSKIEAAILFYEVVAVPIFLMYPKLYYYLQICKSHQVQSVLDRLQRSPMDWENESDGVPRYIPMRVI